MDVRLIAAGTAFGAQRSIPALLLGAVMGTGCGGTIPAVTYFPPEEHVVSTVTLVREPPDVVWDRLLIRIPRKGLVVDTADRKAGKILAVFTTEAAHEFADCGAVASGAGKKESLTRTVSRPGRTSAYRRAAFLRSSVYITVEKDRDGTLVSLKPYHDVFVDTQRTTASMRERWVASRKILRPDGTSYGGEITLIPVPGSGSRSRRVQSLTFVTNTPNTINWGTDDEPLMVNCCSTGKLEALILSLAEPEP